MQSTPLPFIPFLSANVERRHNDRDKLTNLVLMIE